MKRSLKILLAVTVLAGLNACAIYPAGVFHAGGHYGGPRAVVTVAAPPLIIGPPPLMVRPGWGWGHRRGWGHHHGHHH